jgi:hypothetical protein
VPPVLEHVPRGGAVLDEQRGGGLLLGLGLGEQRGLLLGHPVAIVAASMRAAAQGANLELGLADILTLSGVFVQHA